MATDAAFLGSTLNPNAPTFVPQSYKAVEDFSPEWWYLIQSSPSFNQFWTQEHASMETAPQELNDETFDDELFPEEDEMVGSVLEEFELPAELEEMH